MGSVQVKNTPPFYRKLLNILYEEGIRSMSDKARTRAAFPGPEMIYSEPYMGSDYSFPDLVFGFLGRCVHSNWKYSLKGLFLKNNPITRDLSMQFNGVLLVPFFDTYFR